MHIMTTVKDSRSTFLLGEFKIIFSNRRRNELFVIKSEITLQYKITYVIIYD